MPDSRLTLAAREIKQAVFQGHETSLSRQEGFMVRGKTMTSAGPRSVRGRVSRASQPIATGSRACVTSTRMSCD